MGRGEHGAAHSYSVLQAYGPLEIIPKRRDSTE